MNSVSTGVGPAGLEPSAGHPRAGPCARRDRWAQPGPSTRFPRSSRTRAGRPGLQEKGAPGKARFLPSRPFPKALPVASCFLQAPGSRWAVWTTQGWGPLSRVDHPGVGTNQRQACKSDTQPRRITASSRPFGKLRAAGDVPGVSGRPGGRQGGRSGDPGSPGARLSGHGGEETRRWLPRGRTHSTCSRSTGAGVSPILSGAPSGCAHSGSPEVGGLHQHPDPQPRGAGVACGGGSAGAGWGAVPRLEQRPRPPPPVPPASLSGTFSRDLISSE